WRGNLCAISEFVSAARALHVAARFIAGGTMNELQGKKVAILVTDGFEQVEMTEPRKALENAGAGTDLISPKTPQVRGWQHTQWGDSFKVDVSLSDANPDEYDALV